MVDAALDALKGEDKFKGNPVEVRTLMVLYPNRMHVVTIEGTGIEKMADLKGKRVSTGSPGSATEVMAFRVIEAAGLDKDKDMRRERLGVAEFVNAIKDRKIDAFFWVGGLPTAARDRSRRHAEREDQAHRPCRPGRQDERQIRQPLYHRRDSGENLSGTGQRQRDRRGAEHSGGECQDARQGRLRHRQDFIEKRDELIAVHGEAKNITLENQLKKNSPIPWHPGAVKYYTEKGVKM